MSKKISIKQALILAGGIGSRLKPITDHLPKPMIPFHDRPFLEYLIELLKRNGIREVILLLGYLPEKIIDYFQDGTRWGLKIKYSIEDVSCETGTRIKKCEHPLDDHFLALYCDNYWPLPLEKLVASYSQNQTLEKEPLGLVTVYRNRDGITKNNMFVDAEGFVTRYDKSRQDPDLNGVDIGFFIFNKKVLALMPDHNFSLEKEIFPRLIEKRKFLGFVTDHRYYSVGKLERLPVTEKFLRPQRVVFLDRDGVINKKAPKADYVKSWKEFEFLPGAAQAIQWLTRSGYEIFVITNQAGIARGMMSEKDLRDIHENMQRELGLHDARINGVYYCPHGWDEGCECRKPKPGMFFRAAGDHHIDLTRALFIGDDERDRLAGEAAGTKTILVTQQRNLLNIVRSLQGGFL